MSTFCIFLHLNWPHLMAKSFNEMDPLRSASRANHLKALGWTGHANIIYVGYYRWGILVRQMLHIILLIYIYICQRVYIYILYGIMFWSHCTHKHTCTFQCTKNVAHVCTCVDNNKKDYIGQMWYKKHGDQLANAPYISMPYGLWVRPSAKPRASDTRGRELL